MASIRRIKNSIFEFIPGPIYGIIAVVICLSGYLIAYLMYPPSNYSVFLFGSELGIGVGGLIFNICIIVSGIFFLLFYIYLNDLFIKFEVGPKLRQISFIFTIFSTTFFILIGFFPGDPGNIVIFYIHGTAAYFCYLTAVVYIFCLNYIYLKYLSFPKFHVYVGFTISGLIAIFLFVWTPVLQWIFTLPFYAWALYTPSYILYKKL